ncbi:MAG: hypothetical protein AAGA03_19415, partial [Planctomycetota bacterium]
MKDLLAPLTFVPPPFDTPWGAGANESRQTEIGRREQTAALLPSPLFWHSPRWYEMPLELADSLATEVSRLGIVVSALRSELGEADSVPLMHQSSATSKGCESGTPLPRMVPYRSERIGLNAVDFDDAAIIDVRLALPRDPWGRFSYPPAQVQRWERPAADKPLAGGGWVSAESFPPDVQDQKHLENKVRQLRILSPGAAILLTVSPHRLSDELPSLLSAQPDGVILQLSELDLEGLQLAALVRHARGLLDKQSPGLALWLVTDEVTADDVAKLVALGADGVAIDCWCEPLWNALLEAHQERASQFGYDPHSVDNAFVAQVVAASL